MLRRNGEQLCDGESVRYDTASVRTPLGTPLHALRNRLLVFVFHLSVILRPPNGHAAHLSARLHLPASERRAGCRRGRCGLRPHCAAVEAFRARRSAAFRPRRHWRRRGALNRRLEDRTDKRRARNSRRSSALRDPLNLAFACGGLAPSLRGGVSRARTPSLNALALAKLPVRPTDLTLSCAAGAACRSRSGAAVAENDVWRTESRTATAVTPSRLR